MEGRRVRVAVLGASGYIGGEMLGLAAPRPDIEIAALTADRRAGEPLGAVFPHLAGLPLPRLARVEDVAWDGIEAAFCCLPHATTQEIVRALPDRVRVIDLSADFRLRDPAAYERWYGRPHGAPELQREAVYGLTEHARPALRRARIAACPGCYPTAALLPLAPLLRAGAIAPDSIIIDAKSGVSGAGRAVKEGMLYAEVAEGAHAYGLQGHRHAPEIDQELAAAAGAPVAATFVPHLLPMNRGLLATIYVRLAGSGGAEALRARLREAYDGEAFVRVLPEGAAPATRHVRGANLCLVGVFDDRRPGGAVLVSAIDNLVKGAAGQAMQNFNVMFGLPETAGLERPPLFP